MWLSEEIASVGKNSEQVSLGHVIKAESGKITVKNGEDYKDIPLMAPGCINYVPQSGEEVVIVNLGEQAVCSTISAARGNINPGELYIGTQSGAYIWLKNNGQVVINGQVFEKE